MLLFYASLPCARYQQSKKQRGERKKGASCVLICNTGKTSRSWPKSVPFRCKGGGGEKSVWLFVYVVSEVFCVFHTVGCSAPKGFKKKCDWWHCEKKREDVENKGFPLSPFVFVFYVYTRFTIMGGCFVLWRPLSLVFCTKLPKKKSG